MSRPITVRLIGGLGSQLFGYYAGAALAGMRSTGLRVDVSHARRSTTAGGIDNPGFDILGFELPGEWLTRRRLWSAPGRLLRAYTSTVEGHDTTVLTLPAGSRLRGAFPSWKFPSTALDFGYPRRPSLTFDSAWADEIAGRAERERPVIVHVRRRAGTSGEDFGTLGPKYYSSAIDRMRERGVTGPVWVFSDDTDAAGSIVDGEVITGSSCAAEEMWAMSHGAGHVIANSAFGWWSAWMNSPRTPVIAPTAWSRTGPVIEGLIPPEWDRLDADWAA